MSSHQFNTPPNDAAEHYSMNINSVIVMYCLIIMKQKDQGRESLLQLLQSSAFYDLQNHEALQSTSNPNDDPLNPMDEYMIENLPTVKDHS